ncbi:pip, partial [Symbiodinium necroappetens]
AVLPRKRWASALCIPLALNRIKWRRQQPPARIRRSSSQVPLEKHLWEAGNSYVLLELPVRGGNHTVKLKRYEQGRSGRAAVLVLHDGPGLPSRYLEPLAARLCAGRLCFMYDQLGCGVSATDPTLEEEDGIRPAVADLCDVLSFLRGLGQDEIHVLAHGYGGTLIMEALVRDRLWSDPDSTLPKLKSICLMGVASSTARADAEARSLMEACVTDIGDSDAAKSFWYRHVCALKPQPQCLAEAYKSSFGQRWGPLRGWDWKLESPDGTLVGRWALRGKGAIPDWSLTRAEVEDLYTQDEAGLPPIFCLRGQHDFVTKNCLDAWRGVADARGMASGFFTEHELGGCGHHAHLEAPDSVAATLRLWLLDVEDGGLFRSDVPKPPPEQCAVTAHCRPLWREEARRALADWASQMCWESARQAPDRPGAWRSVGQGLPHRDAFAPSRTARRLAEWAWELPAEESCATAKSGMFEDPPGALADAARLALAVLGDEEPCPVLAIVCLEAVAGKSRSFRIVGAAADPKTKDGERVCEEVVREVKSRFA